jgi:hypothetical protein
MDATDILKSQEFSISGNALSHKHVAILDPLVTKCLGAVHFDTRFDPNPVGHYNYVRFLELWQYIHEISYTFLDFLDSFTTNWRPSIIVLCHAFIEVESWPMLL